MTNIIRTSDRGQFKRCRTMWDFGSKIRQNYEPYARIQPLDFGTAIHSGMEAYYDPMTWGNLELQQKTARLAFLTSIAEIQQKVKFMDYEIEQEFNEDLDLGLAMLENYFTWAPTQDGFQPIMTEIEFEIPMKFWSNGHLIDFSYQGRIDLVIEDDFGYWIVDHKTAASLGGIDWLPLDDQCGSYAWALQKKLNLNVRGVIYNELRKKAPHPPLVLKNGGLSKNKQQDTSFEMYLKAIRDNNLNENDYEEFLDYLIENPKEWFRRTRVQYTQHQLEIQEERIKLEAREMLMNPTIYPTPSRFNCQGCSFFRPCLAVQEGSDPKPILEEQYEKRH